MNNSTPVEGMGIVMTCSVKEGTPLLRYSWHHYTSRDSTGTVAETASGLLNLMSANRTHMGWYTCTAHNEINSQTSEPMYLDVICKLSALTVSTTLSPLYFWQDLKLSFLGPIPANYL